jgi:hypothetical protein
MCCDAGGEVSCKCVQMCWAIGGVWSLIFAGEHLMWGVCACQACARVRRELFFAVVPTFPCF